MGSITPTVRENGGNLAVVEKDSRLRGVRRDDIAWTPDVCMADA